MPWGPNSPTATRKFIRFSNPQAKKKPRSNYQFATTLTNGKLFGGCGINIVNPQHREAFIGYCLNRNYWRKGCATEAAKALFQFGFNYLKLHQIFATCDTLNIGSAGVMKKSGLKREGVLRKNIFQKGKWRDTYLFAILYHEGRR